MKNVLFIAPPAGGKGTQSESLVENFGYIHISTGDLLREIDKTTPLGKEIEELMSTGAFISDDIVLELLKNKLASLNGEPFILDGCPRNINQAEKLDVMLENLGLSLDIVIELDVPYDVTLKRATGRISCPKCKKTYNKFFKQPVEEGYCDNCHEKLISRSDDNEETFKVRYDTYMEATAPLIDYYKEKGKLVKVDGINNTFDSIVSVIK